MSTQRFAVSVTVQSQSTVAAAAAVACRLATATPLRLLLAHLRSPGVETAAGPVANRPLKPNHAVWLWVHVQRTRASLLEELSPSMASCTHLMPFASNSLNA